MLTGCISGVSSLRRGTLGIICVPILRTLGQCPFVRLRRQATQPLTPDRNQQGHKYRSDEQSNQTHRLNTTDKSEEGWQKR